MDSRDPLALGRDTMRDFAHRTVDFLIDRWFDADAPPLRRATPDEMRARLGGPPPEEPRAFPELLAQLGDDVLAHASRVDHPRFFAFVPGSGTWPGALADFIASACNVYAGSWMESAGASQVELEVLGWFADWLGYPPEAAGSFVTGGSAANLTALACAREAAGGAHDSLVIYVGDQGHASVARSARVLGFRADQVRVLPVDTATLRLEPATVADAFAADRAAGRRPFALVATAGTTNTGAVDPLAELAGRCAEEGVWLHVDAAYGAFAVLTDRGRAQLAGIERADSIALDPHKWLYQPYECGCLLVRDGRRLRDAFTIVPDYLREASAAGEEVNFSDLGLQLTRTSRALKVWLSIQTFGLAAFRETIDRSLDLAALARERIESSAELELVAPPSLGVVCFRRRFDGDEDDVDRLNAGVVAALEQSGLGLVSSTRVRGRLAIRMCILNHTTSADDVVRVLEFLETAAPVETHGVDQDRSPDVAAALNGRGRELRFAPGEAVVRQWDTTRDFFVVAAGTAEVTVDGERVAVLETGSYFGELAALDWGAGYGYTRTATVTALTPLRVVAFDDAELADVLREHPALERELRRRAGDRLQRH